MSGLGVEHPLWLAATAAALALVVAVHRRSVAGLPRARARASLALRLVALALLGAALAGVTLRRAGDRQCVLFVLDGSDSVPQAARDAALAAARASLARAPAGDRAGMIVFGAQPLVEESPADRPALGAITSRVQRDGTDLAAALRLAAGLFPEGYARRVVLLSDGQETQGAALDEARALAAQGVRVDALPLGAGGRPDALVDRVVLPGKVGEGSAVEVTVLLAASHDGEGTLRLWRDRAYLGSARVKYAAGQRTAHTFRDRVATRGVHHYRAQLEPDGPDAHAANDVGEALAIVEGRAGVLLVHGGDRPPAALEQALRAHGFAVDARPASGLPARLSELAAFSVVLLDDVAAPSLSTAQHGLLAAFVRDLGGGLAMLGGEHAFGAGGWYRTPVEDVLPVSMDLTRKKIRPRVAMAAVLDKSGSMAQQEAGVAKIQLAAEGAVNVVELLSAGDRFGMAAVDTEAHWVLPLVELGGDRSAPIAALRGVSAGGGGILVYTGLRAAYEVIARDSSQVRHLLLFSDTADSEQPVGEGGEHAFDLARRYLAQRITLSVVGIGRPTDADTALLRGLAQAGGGRFYLTESASTVPQIFSQDAMLASRSVIVEKRIDPLRAGASEILRGVDAPPALHGYVAASLKPGATTPLMASDEDPLLAHWSVGLGRALAFTSDVHGRWSREWLAWPGYAKLFAQGVQWLAGARGRAEHPARVTLAGGQGRVAVEALDEDGDFVNFLTYRAQVVPPGQPGFSVPLEQTAPGRYEARFPAPGEGSWLVNVQRVARDAQPSSSQLVAAARPYSAEFRSVGPNLELLRALTSATGGALLEPDLAGIHRHDRPGPAEPIDPWREAVRWAVLLVLADVAVRRLAGWRRGAAGTVAVEESAAARLVERLRTVREARAEQSGVRSPESGAKAPDPAPPPAQPPDSGLQTPDSGLQTPAEHTARLLEAKRRARRRSAKGTDDA